MWKKIGQELALWVGVGQAPAQKRRSQAQPKKTRRDEALSVATDMRFSVSHSKPTRPMIQLSKQRSDAPLPQPPLFRGVGKVTLQRAHPTRGQAANLANEKGEAGVHVRLKRRAPIHTEYFHSRWSDHPELHRERRQRHRHLRHALRNHREHNVPLDNTALAHDSLQICTSPVTGKHIHDNTTTTGVVGTVQKESILFNALSTAPRSCRSREITVRQNESEDSHLNSREKSAGYLGAIQEFSNASENAVRTSAAHVSSANEPKRTTPIPTTTPTVSPTMSAMHAGMRWSFSSTWYSDITERAAPTAAISVEIPTLAWQKGAMDEHPHPYSGRQAMILGKSKVTTRTFRAST